jgi:tetratricopeptide (TPR) repeat protein
MPDGNTIARVERALREGRSQQALDLAKILFRQEPTAANRDLVRKAFLARGRDLYQRGIERDAIILLKSALDAPGDEPAWQASVGILLAQCGSISGAVDVWLRLPEGPAHVALLGHIADAALQRGLACRDHLPETLGADYDCVIRAFAQSESGEDESARATLNGIGLRSPFVDWKLLIRGLLAYYASDDVRALENWQRLDPERLPARLVAPLRQAIDAEFRIAQPAATQLHLQKLCGQLQGSILATRLRELRTALADKNNLAPAFRLAETLLPDLRREAPALAQRLAHVFYWSITETGPDDLPRYQRVFGRPANDPQFHRLQALAYDRGGDYAGANKHWHKYEQEITANAEQWPDGYANRARALIWLHMGQNAARIPARDHSERNSYGFAQRPRGPRTPGPTSENCFQRACELAPGLLETHEALLVHYFNKDDQERAEAAAKSLLQSFPDHVSTLKMLGSICGRRDDQETALSLYQRALHANPLDRSIRSKTAIAHLAYARVLAAAKQIEAAREQIRAAVALQESSGELVFLTRAAAVELKAGNDSRAEELLAQARQVAGSDLIVAYDMMTEVARLKLPKSAKARFESEFNAGLAAPPDGAAAAGLAGQTAALTSNVPYVGQKAHQKKVFAYLESAKKARFTEAQLQETCTALVDLGSVRLARFYIHRGLTQFRRSPYFPYLEAVRHFHIKPPEEMPVWTVRPLLEKAEKLARALPETETLKKMLDDIGDKLKQLAASCHGGLDSIFDTIFGDPFDADDED